LILRYLSTTQNKVPIFSSYWDFCGELFCFYRPRCSYMSSCFYSTVIGIIFGS